MTWLYALLLPTVLPAYAASTETEGAVAVSPQSREERSGVTVLPAVTVSAQRPGADTEGTGSYTTGTTKAATGLSLSPRETPQSVTVVTRQRMDDQQLNSVKDVLENTTGISSTTLDTERVSYYSRGFSIDSFQYDGVPTTYIPGSFLPGEGCWTRHFTIGSRWYVEPLVCCRGSAIRQPRSTSFASGRCVSSL
ncbi:TonB-dependent receptor plug domain-containing protein [Pseudomonas aeruginosa]|nr:TonB-dependent receptor plug domain-containing protein [Pseudomonas aeruginosa]